MATYQRLDYAYNANWTSLDGWNSSVSYPGAASGDVAYWGRSLTRVTGAGTILTNLTFVFPNIMTIGTSIVPGTSTAGLSYTTSGTYFTSNVGTSLIGYGNDFLRTVINGNTNSLSFSNAAGAMIGAGGGTLSVPNSSTTLYKEGLGIIGIYPGSFSFSAGSSFGVRRGWFWPASSSSAPVILETADTPRSIAKAPIFGMFTGITQSGLITVSKTAVLSVNGLAAATLLTGGIKLNSDSYFNILTANGVSFGSIISVSGSSSATINVSGTTTLGNATTFTGFTAASSVTALRFDGSHTPSYTGGQPGSGTNYASIVPTATLSAFVRLVVSSTVSTSLTSMATPTNAWAATNSLTLSGSAWAEFVGKAAAVGSQTFAGLTLGTAGNPSSMLLGITLNAGTSMVVNFGAITRTTGLETIGFLSNVTPSTVNGFRTSVSNVNGIIGGWATSQTSAPGTIAVANTPDTWAVASSTSGITGLTAFTFVAIGNNVSNYTNLNINQATSLNSGFTGGTSLTPNSWLFSATSAVTLKTTTNTPVTMTLGSGGMLYRQLSSGGSYGLYEGTIRANNGPLYIHAGAGSITYSSPTRLGIYSTIADPVSGTGAVVFAGKAYTYSSTGYYQRVLIGGNNTYTGGTYILGGAVDMGHINAFGTNGAVTLTSTYTAPSTTTGYQYGSQLGLTGTTGFSATNPITVIAYLDPPAITFRRFQDLLPLASSNATSFPGTYSRESVFSSPVFDYSTGTVTMSPSVSADQPRGLVLSLVDGSNAGETSSFNWTASQWSIGSQVNYSADLTLNTNAYFRVVGTPATQLTWAPKAIITNSFPLSVILSTYSALRFDGTNTTGNITSLNVVSVNQVGSAVVTPSSALTYSTVAFDPNELSLYNTAMSVTGSNFSKLATGINPLLVAWLRVGASLTYGQQNVILASGSSYNIEAFGSLSTNGGISSPNATGYIVARNNSYFQSVNQYNVSYSDLVALFSSINGRIELSSGNTNNFTNFNGYNSQTLWVKASITQDATGSYSPNYYAGLGAVFVSGTNTHTGTAEFVLGGAPVYNQNIVVYSPAAVGGPLRPIQTRGAHNTTAATNSGTYLLWNDITNPIQFRGGWFTLARQGTSGNWGAAYGFPSWSNTYTISGALTSGNVTDSVSLPNNALVIQSGVTLNFTGTVNFTSRSVNNTFGASRLAHQTTTINYSGTYLGVGNSAYTGVGTTLAIRLDNTTPFAEYAMPIFNWSATTSLPGNNNTISLSGGYHKSQKHNGIINSGRVSSNSGYAVVDLNGYDQTFYSDGGSTSIFGGTAYVMFPGSTLSVEIGGPNSFYTLFTGTGAVVDGFGTGTFSLPTTSGTAPRTMSASNAGAGIIRRATVTGPLKMAPGNTIVLESVNADEIWVPISGATTQSGAYLQGLNTFSVLKSYDYSGSGSPSWLSNESAVNPTWNSGVNTTTSLDFSAASTGSTVLLIHPNSLTTAPFTTTNLSLAAGQSLQIAINSAQLRGVLNPNNYPLLTVTGSAPSGWENQFSFATDLNGSTRLTRSLSLVGNTLTALLGINRTVWKGSASSVWSGTNWELQSNPGSLTTFTAGDCALFDDSASTGTVSITTSVNPALININNNSLAYSVSTSGGSILQGTAANTMSVIYKTGVGSVYWSVATSSNVVGRPGVGIYVMEGTFKQNISAGDNFNGVYIAPGAKYVLGSADGNPTPNARTFSGVGGILAMDAHMTAAAAGRTINLTNIVFDMPRDIFSADLVFENTAGGATVNGSYAVQGLTTTVNFQSNITVPSGVTFFTRGTNSFYPNDWTVAGAGLGSVTASIAVQPLTGLPYCGNGALTLAPNSAILGNIVMTAPTKISGQFTALSIYGAWVGYYTPSSNDVNVGVVTGSISGNFKLTVGLPSNSGTNYGGVVLAGNNTYVGDTWIGDEILGATPSTGSNVLIIGANGTTGTLGVGTAYINAAGRASVSELVFNRTDSYTLPGSIRAYSASASNTAILSVDTGTVVTNGVTVSLLDVGGSGRAGSVIIGRNTGSYASSRTLSITNGTVLTANGITFNSTFLPGISNSGTFFGGNVTGGGLYGTGTLSISGTSQVNLSGNLTVGGNSLTSGSFVNGRIFTAFTGVVNVTDQAQLTASGPISTQVGQNLTLNLSGSSVTIANAVSGNIGSSVFINMSDAAQLRITNSNAFPYTTAQVWNLSGTPLIVMTANGTALTYTQINGSATITTSTVGASINLVSSALTGFHSAGVLQGGTLTFSSDVGLANFYTTSSFPNTLSSAWSAFWRNNNVTTISSVLAGSPSVGFATQGSTGRYKFTAQNTSTRPFSIGDYSVVEFASGSRWNGDVVFAGNNGSLTGKGTIYNLNIINSTAPAQGCGIVFDGRDGLSAPGLVVENQVTGAGGSVYVTGRNMPYGGGGVCTITVMSGFTYVSGGFLLSDEYYYREPILNVGTGIFPGDSLLLQYKTQTSTWTNTPGYTWADGGGGFTGTSNFFYRGDYAIFNTTGIVIVKDSVMPGKMLVTGGSTITFSPDTTTGATNTLACIQNCCEGLTIDSGSIMTLTIKNNYIVGEINVNGTLNTGYRNSLYSVPALRLNASSTFAPTDITSVNGVVFALETGNLYIDDPIGGGNQTLVF